MLKARSVSVPKSLVCDRLCLDLHRWDFLYYDKDGFELNHAEQKYYSIMGYKLNNCLNHNAYAIDWYSNSDPNLLLDHSLILFRCEYSDCAAKQLTALSKSVPQASLLLNTKAKWGFDFALDAVDDNGDVYEVLHIEYDSKNYQEFMQELNKVQQRIDSIDWLAAATDILKKRSEWQSLSGFMQNDWKARYLLNWSRAEYTEKAI